MIRSFGSDFRRSVEQRHEFQLKTPLFPLYVAEHDKNSSSWVRRLFLHCQQGFPPDAVTTSNKHGNIYLYNKELLVSVGNHAGKHTFAGSANQTASAMQRSSNAVNQTNSNLGQKKPHCNQQLSWFGPA